VAGEGTQVELFKDKLFRRIIDAADLFNHYFFFFLNLFGRKYGVGY